jgi:hypothetical protein
MKVLLLLVLVLASGDQVPRRSSVTVRPLVYINLRFNQVARYARASVARYRGPSASFPIQCLARKASTERLQASGCSPHMSWEAF